jgi:hypothetical protein
MDWDFGAGTGTDAVPEPEHGWVAEPHDPDLGSGYGSDAGHGDDQGGDVVYDEDHYEGSGSVEPIADEEEPSGSGHSRALPIDTDGDGDYDRVLVDRDGDGDYDRPLPAGDEDGGRGRR